MSRGTGTAVGTVMPAARSGRNAGTSEGSEAMPKRERGSPDRASGEVGGEIAPARFAARQPDLMGLVERADERAPCHCEQQCPAVATTAGEAEHAGEHREYGGVDQFVPGRLNRVRGDGLRPEYEQADRDRDGERRGSRAYGAR